MDWFREESGRMGGVGGGEWEARDVGQTAIEIILNVIENFFFGVEYFRCDIDTAI